MCNVIRMASGCAGDRRCDFSDYQHRVETGTVACNSGHRRVCDVHSQAPWICRSGVSDTRGNHHRCRLARRSETSHAIQSGAVRRTVDHCGMRKRPLCTQWICKAWHCSWSPEWR